MGVEVSKDLWNEFHHVVNMTSRELREWLGSEPARSDAGTGGPDGDARLGERVADILAKRPGDLTEDDVDVMRRVVETVRDQRASTFDTKAGDSAWRHRLMSLGHDPLRPV